MGAISVEQRSDGRLPERGVRFHREPIDRSSSLAVPRHTMRPFVRANDCLRGKDETKAYSLEQRSLLWTNTHEGCLVR